MFSLILSSFAILSLIFYLGLASIGHRFLIHQFYVSRLLKLFECGQRRVEKFNRKLQKQRKNGKIIIKKQNSGALDPSPDRNSIQSLDSDYDSDSDQDIEVPESFRKNCSMTLKLCETQNELELSTIMGFAKLGIQAIVDDEVTKRFAAEELNSWNLMTRTDKIYHYKSFKLTLVWLSGFLFRYLILLPLRFSIFLISVLWLLVVTAVIGLIPESRIKRTIYYYMSIMCFRIISRAFGGIITYHDKENKAKPGGICVANHTSPIDVCILHCANSYALVGQRQGGFLGILQRALARATHHIWFDRYEMNDRQAVSKRLHEHAKDKKKLPILIFPEGTCINNSAVMMFKKGSFEIGATIYPVAIKYDPRFGDPFWNSGKYGYMRHLFMIMTSWAIVCDVWYLPPMTKHEDESAIDFANRVKSKIASKGGLVDMEWDGQLKRLPVKPELVKQQQLKFSQTLGIKINKDGNNIKDKNQNFIYTNIGTAPKFQQVKKL